MCQCRANNFYCHHTLVDLARDSTDLSACSDIITPSSWRARSLVFNEVTTDLPAKNSRVMIVEILLKYVSRYLLFACC